MSYYVYLKRSLQRRFFRHFFFFAIITCAMVLPLVLSIYTSSLEEGIVQYVHDSTKGAMFWIENAEEKDLRLFTGIESLDARYEDHVIYLSLAEGADPNSEELNEEQEHQIIHILSENEGVFHPINNFYFGKDESFSELVVESVKKEWFIAGISLLIFVFSCGAYLRLFRTDIGALRSIGANKKQIVLIFCILFLLFFIPAGFASAGIALGMMKLLYRLYLGTTMQGFLWFVFSINAGRFLIHYLPFCIVGLLFVVIEIIFLCKDNILSMMHEANTAGHVFSDRKSFFVRRSPAKLLSAFFLRRTNRSLIMCAALVFLTMLPVIHATNQFSVAYRTAGLSDYDIYVFCDDYYSSLLSVNEVDEIVNMAEVDEWRTKPVLQPTNYLILDSRMMYHTDAVWDEIPCAYTNISRAEKYDSSIAETLGKYDVIVTSSFEHLPYQVGDNIILQPTEKLNEGPIQLHVAALADIPRNEYMVDLFISEELYDEISKGLPVGEIDLRLKNRSSAPEVALKIQSTYPILKDLVLDQYSVERETERIQVGHELMDAIMYSLMVLCVSIIVFLSILEHFKEQEPIRDILRNVGATGKMIRSAYIYQTLVMFLISTIPSMIAGYTFTLISIHRTGFHINLSLTTVMLQGIVIVLAGLAFMLPVLLSGKQLIKEGFINE